MTMMLTEFSSRLKVRPRTLARVNSTISPYMMLERPYTRAMPSPTSSTRPTSRVSRRAPKFLISSVSTEVISSALNFITASRDNLGAKVVEAGEAEGAPLLFAHDGLLAPPPTRVPTPPPHPLPRTAHPHPPP